MDRKGSVSECGRIDGITIFICSSVRKLTMKIAMSGALRTKSKRVLPYISSGPRSASRAERPAKFSLCISYALLYAQFDVHHTAGMRPCPRRSGTVRLSPR